MTIKTCANYKGSNGYMTKVFHVLIKSRRHNNNLALETQTKYKKSFDLKHKLFRNF